MDPADLPASSAVQAPSWDALVAGSGVPRAEARALAEFASGRPRSWLIAHGDEPADPPAAERFAALAARARAGEPHAYLTGSREFHGRPFDVDPAVLIPRHDTEHLVERALSAAPHAARVLDLGTGSGCIAVTLAAERPDLRVTATDRSAAALAVARRNAERLLGPSAAGLRLLAGDWYDALPAAERFELIVSNPPYIAAADPHLGQGDLPYEPRGALTDDGDGLSALRAIVSDARRWLVPGGALLLEHGWDQGAPVRTLMRDAGLVDVVTTTDLGGRDRVTQARSAPSD